VCPTDLRSIGLALEQLGKSAEEVQPLFVTLDPDRDTPQRLASYVAFFHPRLIGLTGDASSIRQAARAYKVYFAKVPTSEKDYTIDHSGYIYLMDRAGHYLGFFPPGTPPERMAEVIRPLVEARRP
jgi:protein SCO1/2